MPRVGAHPWGEPALEVKLVKVSYRIPTPEQVARNGYYVAEELLARTGKEEVVHTERCASAVIGQLPDDIRAAQGLPPLPEGAYKPWIKRRKAGWERAHGRR
ncbi:MAG: hypothetical protein IPK74_00420 [Deltaproteobacteria bacterium]|nr:hypothetical protein [Deltaproteobacteria bacterium]